MTAQYTILPFRITDSNNQIIVGATGEFFEAGTNTPLAVYSDTTLTTPISQPIATDGGGFLPQIFLAVDEYKLVVKDDAGVTIRTIDNIEIPTVPVLSTQTFVLSNGEYFAGIDQNNQTGTTYTIQNSDWAKVVTYNNPNPVTVTLPSPTGSTFIDRWFSWHTNIGSGIVTINAGANINGSSSYVLYPNYSVGIISNGSTYYTIGGNAADLIARASSTQTLVSGSFTLLSPFSKVKVDTEGGAATDDLTDIVGGVEGKVATVSITNSARNIVVKNNAGLANSKIINPRGQDITLDDVNDCVLLQYDATLGAWIVIAVSNTNQKSIANYVSADTAMPAFGTSQSFTHGLGGQPFMYSVWLVNGTTEGGYAVGDAIMVSAFGDATSSPSTNYGITTYTNAANTQIIVRVSSQGIILPHATTGSTFAPTAANWNIRVKAFRFV